MKSRRLRLKSGTAASLRNYRQPPPHTSETSLGPHLVALTSTPNFQLPPSQHRRQLIFANLPVSADDTRADDRVFLVHVLPLDERHHPSITQRQARSHIRTYIACTDQRGSKATRPVSSQSARRSEVTPRNSKKTGGISSRTGTYFTDGEQILLKSNTFWRGDLGEGEHPSIHHPRVHFNTSSP